MVQAGCRARFTVNDLNFVIETLAKSSGVGSDSLLRLLRDPETLGPVLDDESLHRALIDRPDCLTVSPPFYFYVLVRRAFLRHGLDDRHLCDYVAGVLAEFTRQEALQPASALAPAGARSFGYLGDLLNAASDAPAAQAFGLRCFLADYALFLSGLFKERVDARKHGAPGIGFYESVGQASYRAAAALPQAARENVRGLFEKLAEAFRLVRLSLNEMADRTLHLEPPPI
jgi:hypothetical protein